MVISTSVAMVRAMVILRTWSSSPLKIFCKLNFSFVAKSQYTFNDVDLLINIKVLAHN